MLGGRHILLAVAVAVSACFYTTPINSRPAAEIELLTPGAIHKGDSVNVSARKSHDPNDDFNDLDFIWRAAECSNPMSCVVFDQRSNVENFVFEVPSHQTVRVELIVTDPRGAFENTFTTITPVNRVPTVEVTVDGRRNASGGYTIGRDLEIHARGEDGADMDPLTYQFYYFPPTASQPANVTWEPIDGDSYRLIPDVVGPWEIHVTADDAIETSQAAVFAFQINEDAPPCIASTTPGVVAGPGIARYILRRADPPRRFAVLSVIDDLDPYPIPQGDDDPLIEPARFRWSVTPPDGPLAQIPGYDLADYWFDPAAYDPGVIATVRVDVSDRVVRPPVCADDVPICPTTGTCRQRLSWELEIR